jgi:hypothetical protein
MGVFVCCLFPVIVLNPVVLFQPKAVVRSRTIRCWLLGDSRVSLLTPRDMSSNCLSSIMGETARMLSSAGKNTLRSGLLVH